METAVMENLIRTLGRRVSTLEHERTALKGRMISMEKRQAIIEKKFDVLDTSVQQQAIADAVAQEGRR